MTYEELKKLTEEQQPPLVGKNEDGENVIITHGCDKWTYAKESWERNFFKITTAQHNGWTRINFVYEDGTSEELYQK